MTRPAISFISAIIAVHWFPFFPLTVIALSSASLLVLFRRSAPVEVLALVLVFLSGVFYGILRQDTLPDVEFPDVGSVVEGTVNEVPEEVNGRVRISIDDVSVEGRILPGKIRLYVPGEGVFPDRMSLNAGDRVRTAVRLKEPGMFRNFGVMAHDPGKEGVIAVGYAKRFQVISRGNGLLAWIHKKRISAARAAESGLDPGNAALHNAIVLGLTGKLSPDIRDSFSASGLAHILSISGTHFGLLAFTVFTAVRLTAGALPGKWLSVLTLHIMPSQAAALAVMPVISVYALFSGMSTPALRSFVMVSIYVAARIFGRKDQWMNSLSIAAMVIILWQPDAVFELSFQLSFLAVLSIGLMLERGRTEQCSSPLRGRDQDAVKRGRMAAVACMLPEKIKVSLVITGAAVAGTLPLTALFFKQVSLVAPLSNLIVTPFVCFVLVPLGVLSSFSVIMLDMATLPLSGVINAATDLALGAVRYVSGIPWSDITVHNPSLLLVMLYCIAFGVWIKSTSRFRYVPAVLVACAYVLLPYTAGNGTEITFLDVGQGDSSVIRLPDKKIMLVDCGTEEPDMGRMVIAPYLRSQGINAIDYLVLSHVHPDHYGGITYLMEHFRIGEVWTGIGNEHQSSGFLRKIAERNITVRVLSRGDRLEAPGYSLYVLHPYPGFHPDSARGEFSDHNSSSLVMKIVFDGASVLFTGDVEKEAEDAMIPLGEWLRSDIIKVAHHGGRTSSSPGFLRAVSPKTAVVSVGRNNSFRHPHQETLGGFADIGARIFRTDRDGAVRISISPGGGPGARTYMDSTIKRAEGPTDEIRNLKLLLFPF